MQDEPAGSLARCCEKAFNLERGTERNVDQHVSDVSQGDGLCLKIHTARLACFLYLRFVLKHKLERRNAGGGIPEGTGLDDRGRQQHPIHVRQPDDLLIPTGVQPFPCWPCEPLRVPPTSS